MRLSKAALIVLAVGSGVLAWPVASQVNAQQPPAAAQGQGQRAGQPPAGAQPAGRGRGPIVAPLPFEDRTGFESMFNGTSLNPGDQQEEAARKAAQAAQAAGGGRGRGGGAPVSKFQDWDGDPKFWRVENGVIVGESAADKTVGPNTFLIWRGGAPGDFELKVEIRMSSTNSGIQYRSRMIPPAQGLPAGQAGHAWRLAGYQMDMDFDNVYPGQLYEEAGRGFLAERGTITYIGPDGAKGVIGQLKTADELKASFKPGDWNTFHLIARGNTLIHIVNGLVTAVCVDDDLKGRSMAGLIGFQLHAGPPMKLELRNLAIKLR